MKQPSIDTVSIGGPFSVYGEFPSISELGSAHFGRLKLEWSIILIPKLVRMLVRGIATNQLIYPIERSSQFNTSLSEYLGILL